MNRDEHAEYEEAFEHLKAQLKMALAERDHARAMLAEAADEIVALQECHATVTSK